MSAFFYAYNMGNPELTQKILSMLDSKGIEYEILEHDAAETCSHAAKSRGLPQHLGAKSVLFKDKEDFRLFTLPAHLQVDNKTVRKILKSQKLRFASLEEFKELTTTVPGALAPFSIGIYPRDLDHYVDPAIHENEQVVFNVGVLNKSIVLKKDDWLSCINPHFIAFHK
jgi:Ala-tRNA(Pro) deacylase